MFLILAMLFIVGLFLIGFGNWLWVNTDYWYGYGYIIWKPYSPLGLVLVICGALVLAVFLGLLFDWVALLIHRRT
jgi:ABC-type nitrate/sulfonate/bicarbonate transport system permease component